MNKIAITTIVVLLSFVACSKKSILSLENENSYTISYSLVPNKKYLINKLWWTRRYTYESSSESKSSYQHQLIINDLAHIEISTIDTSFYERYDMFNGRHPIINPSKMIPGRDEGEDGPTKCYSNNGSELIESNSNDQPKLMNSFNSIGISAWNYQKELPNCNMQIGELIETEKNSWEHSPHSALEQRWVTNKTWYRLDSVKNKICYLKFDSQINLIDSLIRHEYGTLEFDIENRHYNRIERYIDNEPNRVESIIRSQYYPIHDITEIRITNE